MNSTNTSITDGEIVAASFVFLGLTIPCAWLLLIDSQDTMRWTNSMSLPGFVIVPVMVIGIGCWVSGVVLAAVSAGRRRQHRKLAAFAIALHLAAPIVLRGLDNRIWDQPFF